MVAECDEVLRKAGRLLNGPVNAFDPARTGVVFIELLQDLADLLPARDLVHVDFEELGALLRFKSRKLDRGFPRDVILQRAPRELSIRGA